MRLGEPLWPFSSGKPEHFSALYAVLLAPIREQNLSGFQFKTALLAALGFFLLTGLFIIKKKAKFPLEFMAMK